MTTSNMGFTFDANSRLMVSDLAGSAVPNTANFVNGFAFKASDGSLYVTSSAVASPVSNMGIAFRNDGAMAIRTTLPSIVFSNGGMPTDSAGVVLVKSAETIKTFTNGLPLTSNLLLKGSSFDAAAWTKGNVTITANARTAPDGSTADAFIESAANSIHLVQQTITKPASSMALSVVGFIEPAARTWCAITVLDSTSGNGVFAYFSLNGNGAVGDMAAFGTDFAITNTGISKRTDGIYAVTLSFTSNADTSVIVQIYGATANSTNTYVGDGATTGLYLWDAELSLSGAAFLVTT